MSIPKEVEIETKELEVNNERKVKKGGRHSKKDLYKLEREEILRRMYEILGITNDDPKIIYLYDLDNDATKREQLLALKEDVQKYYNAGSWSVFFRSETKRPHLSLIRCILKSMDIKFTSTKKTTTRGDKRINTSVIKLD